jgi:hypothetical protein
MFLTRDQIAVYAAAAGAPTPQLAAAIAMAETGGTGNAGAHNPIPPDDSYGLWQINMIGAEGPQRRRQLGISSNTQLYDPATNARAMMLISNGGTNFTPWATYTSGRYQKYMPPGTATTLPSVEPAGILGDLTSPLQGLIGGGESVVHGFEGLIKAGLWLSKASNWVRIGYVAGGGVMLIVGLAMLVKDQELKVVAGSAGKILGKTAKAVATNG